MFGDLVAHVALNNVLHVVTYQKALGNYPGRVRIPLRDPELESDSGGGNGEAAGDREPVDVLELDSLNM